MRHRTYQVPDYLVDACHGDGHALAAITDGQLVRIVYVVDALPGFEPAQLDSAIMDDRLAPTIRELQPYGQISFGMLSDRKFTEM